jgi:putative NIF3 family GTP cyclohydrolase 1 type 2
VIAAEVELHLRSLNGGWVNWTDTTDAFLAGDPEIEPTGIAVGWMGSRAALEEGLRLGCNLFITHEPIFYNGQYDDEGMLRSPAAQAKREWLSRSGLTVLRCHDLWDQLPGIGIPDSWARLLGFDRPIVGEGYCRVFDVRGRTAGAIAEQVASATRFLGQDAVELLGSPDTPVSRLALGTGAITPVTHFLETYHADIALCSDDGFTYWREGSMAADLGIPIIVVNHAVSEIEGMRHLAEHLRERFPALPIHFIPQTCMYRLVFSP